MPGTLHRRHRRLTAALALALLAACSPSADDGSPRADAGPTPSGSSSPTARSAPRSTTGPPTSATPSPTDGPTSGAPPADAAAHPISVPALAEQQHRGDRLRLGAVREQTARYTSYDVSFRSRTRTGTGWRDLRISGVLNVPRGRGPFPAVVLAHGYIDPAVYVRGQGMTRERGYLADRGFVAFHVDYRNHAASGNDLRVDTAVRLGYSVDVVNAVQALRRSSAVPVDGRRMALFGRSMGSGVVLKALISRPGLVRAGVAWASVSSLEAENYRHFTGGDPDRGDLRRSLSRRHGLPDENPRFWRGLSARPYLDRITEPVLLVHGRLDDTCPPRWARATRHAMARAGVDSRLVWYDDGHAFGPAFYPAMARTVRFLQGRLGAR